MQSAALVVVREAGGYGGLNDRFIDLRVDDHTSPIAELGRGGMAVVYLAALQGPRGFSKLAVVKELKEEIEERIAGFQPRAIPEARSLYFWRAARRASSSRRRGRSSASPSPSGSTTQRTA